LKNDVKNVASKSKKQKKNTGEKIIFSCHPEGHCRKQQDPDPLVKGGTDPRISISTKMSRV
jgi:hypothetical protein